MFSTHYVPSIPALLSSHERTCGVGGVAESRTCDRRAHRVGPRSQPICRAFGGPDSSSSSVDSQPSGDVSDGDQRAENLRRLPSEARNNYDLLQNNPLIAPFLQWGGFRDRLLADPGFLVKVGIEVGIGICTKTAAERTKRGEMFFSELDFVLANVLMALIADFCLVWLPAPTASAIRSSEQTLAAGVLQHSPILRHLNSCPENCFQKVQGGSAPFTVQQRAGALLVNGLKLVAVGLGSSLVGVGVVNGLIQLRQHLDPAWTPLNPPQNILATSLAYGTYMATSSNFRYQVIAGIVEERCIEEWFKGNQRLCGSLSFVVRVANTYLGSLWWVDFLRILGVQPAGTH